MYKTFIRPLLFLSPPEKAHQIIFFFLKALQKIPGCIRFTEKLFTKKRKTYNFLGLQFPNRVGLAAGLDKEAEAFDILGAMGFGFVEIGTLTPDAQPGNPKPRLFRLVKDKALINRMGFNNKGVKNAVKNLKRKKTKIIIGGNIGKNKLTPNVSAHDDYIAAFNLLYPYIDYFAVNLSSPNTPKLRELQNKDSLMKILGELTKLNAQKSRPKPILLKIAPDISDTQLDDIIAIVLRLKIHGIIATNTTIDRKNLSCDASVIKKKGSGGLSGQPLKEKSTRIIRQIKEKSKGQIPIIASGGIMSAQDAEKKIAAGAELVQIYTGFIYEGPGLIKKIAERLDAQNLKR